MEYGPLTANGVAAGSVVSSAPVFGEFSGLRLPLSVAIQACACILAAP
jgi:hypothetical protein